MGRSFQKLFSPSQALGKAHGPVGDAHHARDAVLVKLLVTRSQAASQEDRGHALRQSPPGHTHRRFVIDCGEVLLSPDVARRFQEAVWSGKSATRTAKVPVYDLGEMQ